MINENYSRKHKRIENIGGLGPVRPRRNPSRRGQGEMCFFFCTFFFVFYFIFSFFLLYFSTRILSWTRSKRSHTSAASRWSPAGAYTPVQRVFRRRKKGKKKKNVPIVCGGGGEGQKHGYSPRANKTGQAAKTTATTAAGNALIFVMALVGACPAEPCGLKT